MHAAQATYAEDWQTDDPFDPWTEAEMDADAAHVAELVECGDLCGMTVFGVPFRRINDE